MAQSSPYIRDFLYLDWERVRSFAAQLLEGIPQDSARQSGLEGTTKLTAGGGLPFIAKAQAEQDVRYFATNNETRSLHHHIYSLVEERLQRLDKVRMIDSTFDFDNWKPDRFREGEFIRVKGIIHISDYKFMAGVIEGYEKLMRQFQNIQIAQLQRTAKPAEVEARKREHQKANDDLKRQRLPDIVDALRTLVGELVRIKVMPAANHPGCLFVGSVLPALFTESMESIRSKYGVEIDADWRCLVQVNRPKASLSYHKMNIGSQIEDSVEELTMQWNNIIQQVSAPVFPALSCTLLSMYREL